MTFTINFYYCNIQKTRNRNKKQEVCVHVRIVLSMYSLIKNKILRYRMSRYLVIDPEGNQQKFKNEKQLVGTNCYIQLGSYKCRYVRNSVFPYVVYDERGMVYRCRDLTELSCWQNTNV